MIPSQDKREKPRACSLYETAEQSWPCTAAKKIVSLLIIIDYGISYGILCQFLVIMYHSIAIVTRIACHVVSQGIMISIRIVLKPRIPSTWL